jgi:hypothetical protein
MKWHVIHTKVREEFRALENLQAQGFEVFLPTCQVQKNSREKFISPLSPCSQDTYSSVYLMSPVIGFQSDQPGVFLSF